MLKKVFSLSILSFFGYAVGFLNQLIIAKKFGTSSQLDLYLLSLSVVNFGWFFVGPINEISIPDLFIEIQKSKKLGSIFFSKVFNIILIFCFLMSGMILIFLPFIYRYVTSGAKINYPDFEINVYLLLPIILLTALSQYFQTVLSSLNEFTAQSLGKIVTASISVLFLVLFFDLLEIKSIIFGMELGLFFFCLVQYLLIKNLNIYYMPLSGVIIEKKYYKYIFALIFTYFLSALQLLFERFVFMSFGPGTLSSYNYSQALLQVPQMIVVTGVVAIAFTNFMTKVHLNDINNGLDELFSIAIKSFFASVIISITIYVLSREIVYLLFFRGKFDLNSLNKTSDILKILIFTLPFLVFSSILGRAIVALKRFNILLKINSFTSISLIILLAISYWLGNIIFCLLIFIVIHFFASAYKVFIYDDFYDFKNNIVKRSFVGLFKSTLTILIYSISVFAAINFMDFDLIFENIIFKLFCFGVLMAPFLLAIFKFNLLENGNEKIV